MKFVFVIFMMSMMPGFALADMDPALQGKKAETFVQALGDDAISSLKSTVGDASARRGEFKRILSSKFDMDMIARFALGRYWAIARDDEKKQYTRLFKDMVIDVYTQRFSDYSDQELDVVGSKAAGRKDFIVNTLIKGSSQPVRVDWRVRNDQVIDVIVEGVSMSVTQRSEFASIIQRNGGKIESLISYLQK